MKPATSGLSKDAFGPGTEGSGSNAVTEVTPVNSVSPTIVTTTTAPLSSTVVNRPVTDKWALVVGVSKFADPTIPPLHYAAKDAKDFADYLVKKANFAPDHVRLLTNEQATQRRILSELGDKFLPRVVKKDDLVVIFYSSHGSPASRDVAKANYLVAYDTNKNDLFATGIEAANITRLLRERLDAKRILIVMDACHSGGGADGAKDADDGANFDVNSLPLGSGQMLISSSNADERSWESKRYSNGIFTHHLMQSMDKNGSKSTVGTIFQDMQDAVAQEVQQDDSVSQTPKLRNDQWTGNDLVLAVVPSNPMQLPPLVKQYFQQQPSVGSIASSVKAPVHSATAASVSVKPTLVKPFVSSGSTTVTTVTRPTAISSVTSTPVVSTPVIQFKPMPDSRPSSGSNATAVAASPLASSVNASVATATPTQALTNGGSAASANSTTYGVNIAGGGGAVAGAGGASNFNANNFPNTASSLNGSSFNSNTTNGARKQL